MDVLSTGTGGVSVLYLTWDLQSHMWTTRKEANGTQGWSGGAQRSLWSSLRGQEVLRDHCGVACLGLVVVVLSLRQSHFDRTVFPSGHSTMMASMSPLGRLPSYHDCAVLLV